MDRTFLIVAAFAGFSGATRTQASNAAALFPVFEDPEEPHKKGLAANANANCTTVARACCFVNEILNSVPFVTVAPTGGSMLVIVIVGFSGGRVGVVGSSPHAVANTDTMKNRRTTRRVTIIPFVSPPGSELTG